jgi:hypothetical protein
VSGKCQFPVLGGQWWQGDGAAEEDVPAGVIGWDVGFVDDQVCWWLRERERRVRWFRERERRVRWFRERERRVRWFRERERRVREWLVREFLGHGFRQGSIEPWC